MCGSVCRRTLTAVGFQLERLYDAGACVTHQQHGDPFPKMHWGLNYLRLASATMWTLFWAGNDLAPETKVDGEPVQDWLQGHYFKAMAKVAETLKNEPNVLGFDSLNEPSPGWVGREAPLDSWGLPFQHVSFPVTNQPACWHKICHSGNHPLGLVSRLIHRLPPQCRVSPHMDRAPSYLLPIPCGPQLDMPWTWTSSLTPSSSKAARSSTARLSAAGGTDLRAVCGDGRGDHARLKPRLKSRSILLATQPCRTFSGQVRSTASSSPIFSTVPDEWTALLLLGD